VLVALRETPRQKRSRRVWEQGLKPKQASCVYVRVWAWWCLLWRCPFECGRVCRERGSVACESVWACHCVSLCHYSSPDRRERRSDTRVACRGVSQRHQNKTQTDWRLFLVSRNRLAPSFFSRSASQTDWRVFPCPHLRQTRQETQTPHTPCLLALFLPSLASPCCSLSLCARVCGDGGEGEREAYKRR
jgi:hypothetical protein